MNHPVFLNNQKMTVDAKLRVGIPERFVKVLKQICPDHPNEIGISATPDRSIKLTPYTLFAEDLDRWSKLDDQVTDERTILNLTTSFADLLTMDKQNRIRLSPELCSFCNISREVIVVGTIKYMQIFDLKTWNTMMQEGIKKLSEATDAVATRAAAPQPVNLIVQAEGKEKANA